MINVTLKQIKAWIDCEIDEQYLNRSIQGVTIDSRAIKKICYLYLLKVKTSMVIFSLNKHSKMVQVHHFIKRMYHCREY